MAEKVYIFSSGSQYGDWYDSNCGRCKKSDINDLPTCDIDEALGMALFDDGKVTPEIALRAGVNAETAGRYIWPCSEVDWTEDWKAEFRASEAT